MAAIDRSLSPPPSGGGERFLSHLFTEMQFHIIHHVVDDAR